MKTTFFALLLFFTPTLSAELPCFEVSLGGGVQHDQAWFNIINPSTDTNLFSSKYTRLWIPYVRGEIGVGWYGLLGKYQADIGKGNLGKSNLSLALSAIPVPFKADLTNSRLWNQRAILNYDLSFFCFHFLPAVGWNRFESHWKVGPSTPPVAPSTIAKSGRVDVNLSGVESDVLEQFSGAFIGGDVAFAFGPLQVTAGYRYTFGNFSTHFDTVAFTITNPGTQIHETIRTNSFSATGEGQIGTASIEWWILPILSIYCEGEGRWIQKRKGNLRSNITEKVTTSTQVNSVSRVEFESFRTRWDSYDITLGARVSF